MPFLSVRVKWVWAKGLQLKAAVDRRGSRQTLGAHEPEAEHPMGLAGVKTMWVSVYPGEDTIYKNTLSFQPLWKNTLGKANGFKREKVKTMTGSLLQCFMSVCVCQCEFLSKDTFSMPPDMYLPERLPLLGKKKNLKIKKIKALLQYGRELPTSTADWGLFYSVLVCCCACTYMSFQSSLFFLLGVGYQGWGWVFMKERREKNRVFCYCRIRGWQYVYIYIVYMWWKCFLCDTTFYLYYGSTFSVPVLLIYIWFVF